MAKVKAKTKASAKPQAKAKRSSTSPAKSRGRRRNADGDQALSFDPIATNDMRTRTKRTPKQPAQQSAAELPRAGTDRVIAEWDKVDAALDKVSAALIAFARGESDQVMPPLTIKALVTDHGSSGEARAWAVVSADPQIPLTEKQAREIVAAMEARGTSAPIGIAAE